MTAPSDDASEAAEVARRLRAAIEMQAILRGDEPPAKGGARRAARGKAATGKAATNPRVSPAPKVAIAPASRVEEAARAYASWQSDPASFASLGELHDAFSACERCELAKTRTQVVFGVGDPNARLMLIGEAPGRDEDLQGEPFVGAAGQLLTKILEAVGFKRSEVYIANILKCRPPGNRNPEPNEIAACSPILARQIELIRPLILCTLGSFAAKTILGSKEGISRLRGRIHDYRGIPVVPTFHPAALLRNPAWKKPTWEDVQMLRQEYDKLVAASKGPSVESA